jgi:hypothetical protein
MLGAQPGTLLRDLSRLSCLRDQRKNRDNRLAIECAGKFFVYADVH